MAETVSRQAWFLVCMTIGGMFGLFAGALTSFAWSLFNRTGPANGELVAKADAVQK
jgi:hypothetical protein